MKSLATCVDISVCVTPCSMKYSFIEAISNLIASGITLKHAPEQIVGKIAFIATSKPIEANKAYTSSSPNPYFRI